MEALAASLQGTVMTGDEEQGEDEETHHTEEVRRFCDRHVVCILQANHIPQLKFGMLRLDLFSNYCVKDVENYYIFHVMLLW